MAATQMSKKRKVSPLKEYDFHADTRPDFVADGVFLAELNEVPTRELAEDGYSGVEVRATPVRTEIIIRATRLGTFSADSLCYKLLGGLAVRRACCGVHRFVMESGAKRCEVIVSGKLRAQRAKSMKFKDVYMISSGQPVNEYIDAAVWHVLVRQGVLGIKLKIMLDWDPKGKQGPKTPLPDLVTVHQPKEDYIRLPVAVVATEIPVGLVAS